MQKFRVTYEIVTPESAEHGDTEECGFVAYGGWRVSLEESKACADAIELDLRGALDLCNPDCDCGAWFSESDGREDYRTGERETRSLHPPRNITAASYGRLRRLLGIRR